MSDIFTRFLTPWRLKWYPRVALLGLLLGMLIALMSSSGSKVRLIHSSPQFGRLGGDYVEFYGAGKIVLAGDFDKLYDPKEQCLMQRDVVLQKDTFIPFAYPPQMALFYSLFSTMPFRISCFVHVLFMLGLLASSVYLIKPRNVEYYELVFALSLFYFPLLSGTFGGQNTPLSIFLLCASYSALKSDRQVLSGICLGLLLYKPQLAIVMLCLLLLIGRWRAFAAGAGIGLLLYLVDCYYFGADWVVRWFSYAKWVVTTSMSMEGENAISWIGFLRNALGVEAPVALAAGYLLAGLTALTLAVLWWLKARQTSLLNLYGLAAAGIILISPHTYYYDAGILLITCFAIYSQDSKFRPHLLSLVWLLGFTQLFAGYLHFGPVFFSVLISFFFMALVVMKANGDDVAANSASLPAPARPAI